LSIFAGLINYHNISNL